MRTVVPKNARLIPDGAERVFKGVMYDVYQWPQKMYDGKTATFEMIKRLDTVKVLAVKGNKLVFIEETQPTHATALAMPGGRHDVASETELECAKREVLEETGMSFKTWKLIDAHQPFDEMEWLVYLFVATDFENHTTPHVDGGEQITITELTYDEALKLGTAYPSIQRAVKILQTAGSIDGLAALPGYR